ncbi:MAG: peptidoglycan DD-metalloendopeptidase family protein [Bacteroidales bacterium]
MNAFLAYLLKANICLVVFGVLFLLAFYRSSFFKWNRYYLVLSLLLSFILPLVQVSFRSIPNEILVSEEMFEAYSGLITGDKVANIMASPGIQPLDFIWVSLALVSSLILLRLIGSVLFIVWIARHSKPANSGRLKIFKHPAVRNTFSVFHFVFLNPSAIQEGRYQIVLEHESCHADQLHSLDRILFELSGLLFWMNPIYWVCRRNLILQHEYLADKGVVVQTGDVVRYLRALNPPASAGFRLIPGSAYNINAIKKRILMLTNRPSAPLSLSRYLLVIPLLGALLIGLSCSVDEVKKQEHLTVTVDQNRFIPSILPVRQELITQISGFGNRIHPLYKIVKHHDGFDFAAATGSEIFATADGIVQEVQISGGGFGNMVTLQHGDFKTRYSHMDTIIVKCGQLVKKGQVIGTVGNTGLSTLPHLHYEVYFQGKVVDPAAYFNVEKPLLMSTGD